MEIVKFHNPGALLERLPENVFLEIQEDLKTKREKTKTFDTLIKRYAQVISVKEIDETPHNKNLYNFLKNMFIKWTEIFDVRTKSNLSFNNIIIDPMWTNYMRPAEFLPMHKHSPSIAVFVIWIKIPYDQIEERKYHYQGKSLDDNSRNGAFEFLYNSYTGDIKTHRIDLNESYEGTVVMFPGSMMHTVYPFFTSNEERISIAGNICVR